jgi:hypothetical protein
VGVIAVIISSMGVVYGPSLTDSQKMLGCTDCELRKLGKKMSETVIIVLMKIWGQNAHEIPKVRGTGEAESLFEEELGDSTKKLQKVKKMPSLI